jgi:RNA polymerase sigma factor (sigma-70 family)
MKISSLSKEERNKLIIEHLWIVDYIARKFSSGRNVSFEDLQSVGGIGLIKAVDNYNDSMGTSFSTYATLIVQGEIRHFLRDKSDILRIPRKYVEQYKLIQDAVQLTLNHKHRMPSIEEIHEITKLPKESIVDSLEAVYAKYPLSLDEPLKNDTENIKVQDTIPVSSDDTNTVIQKLTINTALQKLEPIERRSIVLKYQYDMTYEEIAKKMGIKPGKVVRSIRSGLEKLRNTVLLQEE